MLAGIEGLAALGDWEQDTEHLLSSLSFVFSPKLLTAGCYQVSCEIGSPLPKAIQAGILWAAALAKEGLLAWPNGVLLLIGVEEET